MKIITVVAAVIRRGGKVLLASRPASKPPLGWEFPGGKVEPGENFNAALRRELLEELGVDSVPADRLYKVVTRNAEREIRLHFIRTLLAPDAKIVPKEGQEFRWVELSGEAPEGLLAPDLPVWNFLINFGRP
ncbi:NUDIX domain-containing protein [uncultured Victivallis sp.]|uniref:(deoxy)nucleoside triphosphate pyrophosphohydrolase n=1 Tax=uncultured Victivallis sp. TaxID=354118 RepID=UPI00258470CE|nr:NUDIX domain-containing protein [uncultured Victivallis sp.]